MGQWMTKITSLLRRLIKLRESAPDEKSLVFTQFPDALELVARALRINGFDAAQLSTRQKVCICWISARLLPDTVGTLS